MIYYFSGTGNSLRIARQLAERTHDELIAITPDTPAPAATVLTDSGGRLGLVFPVYGWDVPLIVREFIARWPSIPSGSEQTYCYTVMTCGDDIGWTDRLLRNYLRRKGVQLSAAHSLLMCDTYVCLPGFDVDAPAERQEKELQTAERIAPIAARILRHDGSTPADLIPGGIPWIKTYILRPFFNRFLTTDRHFHVDPARCTRCGRCARLCPMANIRLIGTGTPAWQGHCTMCLACYHGCPVHAIDYGRFTHGKGQVKVMRLPS